MKKIINVCAAALLIATLFLGCSNWQESPYDPDLLEKQEGFSVATEFPSYPKDIKTINLLIKNDSDNEYYYGYQYSIEMERDGKWYVVPLEDEMAFIEIAVSLPAHSTAIYPVSLEYFANPPKAGQYRVIFNQNYVAEFEITD